MFIGTGMVEEVMCLGDCCSSMLLCFGTDLERNFEHVPLSASVITHRAVEV